MAFKYVLALCFVASVAAEALDGLAYQAGHQEEHYAPAHYEFQYAVHDEHTGDIKEQKEQREGDKVVGFYTLVEPDGHKRIVHYQADKHSGFNAQVTREFVGIQAPQQVKKIAIAPIAVKQVVAAPQYHQVQDINVGSYHGGSYNAGNLGSSSSYSSGNLGGSLNYH